VQKKRERSNLPSLVPARPRTSLAWGGESFSLSNAPEGFSRISGIIGSGKSHLTKLYLLRVLEELQVNPHAKLVLYEPKREFYDWLCSLNLPVDISYFLPSDERSVTLDFMSDYSDDKDAETLAYTIYPDATNRGESAFWGDSLRTIVASVYTAIRLKLGRVDLRLLCLVLENAEYTRQVLSHDPYQVQAAELTRVTGMSQSETAQNIQYTLQARIGKLKVLAAQMDRAARKGNLFSLQDFIRKEEAGIFVVSKDETYGKWQDAINGVLFLRLTQLLDKEEEHPKRRVFVVIDEFPSLCGDDRCPGVKTMFLRLRSRGAVPLITDQGLTTLTPIYDRDTTAILGQCTNVVYLCQPDVESAEYASKDLGLQRGFEKNVNVSYGGEYASVSTSKHYFERPYASASELMKLKPASRQHGIEGWAKSPHYEKPEPWHFRVPPEHVDQIPGQPKNTYQELNRDSQRLTPLTPDELRELGII